MTRESRVDLHVKILDDDVVERAKSRGLGVLVYAPHFTRLPAIRERAERFSDDELTVVPAREIFTGTWRNRKHVLALGLTDPVPDFVTLDGAMRAIEAQDAVGLVPHPDFLNVSLDADDVREYRDLLAAVETYNPKHLPGDNDRAQELASEVGVPGFTSSYAHLRWTVGEAWTTFERPVTSEAGLLEALREEVPRRVEHRDGPGHALRCRAEFAHLGYENTWQKVDRILLSGMEPTHPDHVAYDGAFDDVRVY